MDNSNRSRHLLFLPSLKTSLAVCLPNNRHKNVYLTNGLVFCWVCWGKITFYCSKFIQWNISRVNIGVVSHLFIFPLMPGSKEQFSYVYCWAMKNYIYFWLVWLLRMKLGTLDKQPVYVVYSGWCHVKVNLKVRLFQIKYLFSSAQKCAHLNRHLRARFNSYSWIKSRINMLRQPCYCITPSHDI